MMSKRKEKFIHWRDTSKKAMFGLMMATLVLSVFALTQVNTQNAAAVSASIDAANNLPGQISSYTIKFTITSTTLLVVDDVKLTAPTGYDVSSARLVRLEGSWRGDTTLSVAGQVLTLEQPRPSIFKSTVQMVIDLANIRNPFTEGPHTWTIQLFDRDGNVIAAETANVAITLKNIQIVGVQAGTEDNSADGSTADPAFDLTVNSLKVGTSLALTSNEIDTTASGGADDITIQVANSNRMLIKEDPTATEGLVKIFGDAATVAANDLLLELEVGGGTVFSVDKEGDVVQTSLTISSSTPTLTLMDTDGGGETSSISQDTAGGVSTISFNADTGDGAEMMLTDAGLLTIGTGTLKIDGNNNFISAVVGDLELKAGDTLKMVVEASPDPTEGQGLVRVGQAAATAANTLLFEVREAGSTVFKVDKEGDVQMDGTLQVGSSITIDGGANTIDTTGGGGITIGDPLTVTGTTMLAAVSTSGLATLSGGASVSSGLSVTGGTSTDTLSIGTFGTGTLSAGTTTIVADTRVTATSTILVTVTSSSFAGTGINCGVVATAPGSGFTIECSGAAAGTESFNYVIIG